MTTIAPSTMMPKSIAPSDSKFAGMLVKRIKINAIRIDSGMVVATISELRGLPKNSISTKITRPMPSTMVCETVFKVVFTSSVRSMYGITRTSAGSRP